MRKIIASLIIASILCGCQIASDHLESDQDQMTQYCGYLLSTEEFNLIGTETFGNPNPYLTENSSEVFLEIYNTIKTQVDSTVQYELSLVKLKNDQVWLDLKVPSDSESKYQIACTLMKSKFTNLVPNQIKVRIFQWDHNDPNKNASILIGIKRLN
ncbi:MAG: hypothetical protein ACJAUJ_001109 [Salibacteraceae bacterium]